MIEGEEINPELTPINLLAGWNMSSYLRDNPMTTETALSSISANLLIAKNGTGQVYWPAYNINTIGNMLPGQGYQIYVTAPSTLTYPANDVLPKMVTLATKQPPMPAHYTAYRANTGNSATLLIFTAGLPDGAEIGAWTAKQLLVGSGVVSHSMALLTLWGDDTMTQEIDGALESETLTLTCWLSEQNYEFRIYCSSLKDGITQNVMSSILEFRSNAIWLAETDVTANILPESNLPSEFGLVQNYPNPFNPSTTIIYQLPQEARVELILFSLSGAKVRTIVNGIKPAGYHEVLWDGRDDGNKQVPSGIYWVKMIADGYEKTFKISLIK
ncbi:MAG TPA: FlgD immunoglobulin-like domain containing protein [bacterium]|nr:FlgD immunoglobulin-like domain containing protein [bacterium]